MEGDLQLDVSGPVEASPLSLWRQGDYSLDLRDFVVSEGIADGELDVALDAVPGVVVITQTCDIVNDAPGKEYVVLSPLKVVSEGMLREIRRGRSPSAAVLEHPPEETVVVDLSRMMTVRKSVLAVLGRVDGFSSDGRRAAFAESLERKHGRFAFPDAFSEHVLSPLRKWISNAHDKPKSEAGESYRAIRTARVQAHPHWDAENVEVVFRFILGPDMDAKRASVSKTIDEHLARIDWPKGFRASDPAYTLGSLRELSAAEWVSSLPIDWDFISMGGRDQAA